MAKSPKLWRDNRGTKKRKTKNVVLGSRFIFVVLLSERFQLREKSEQNENVDCVVIGVGTQSIFCNVNFR